MDATNPFDFADYCNIKEIDGVSKDCRNKSCTQYPCNPNKKYFVRGLLQLSWNYNFGPAGKDNNFNGLSSPEIIANDAILSFKTVLWFRMKNVRPVVNQGFGATIRAINGPKYSAATQARIWFYTDYCKKQFAVSCGDNLTC